jgi:alpha-ketoglutarate-dependent taurine dioxygenase
MTPTTQSYQSMPGTIGAVLELDDLARLSDSPAALRGLREVLDQRLVVRIVSGKPVAAAALAAVALSLGEPARRGGPRMIPDYDFIEDFSAEAKHDDGRTRVPAFIETLHYDVFANGPAAYGVLHTRSVPAAAPMRFVDMRAVYAALPAATRDKLVGTTAPHYAPAAEAGAPYLRSEHPVAARHAGSAVAVLVLSNLRDTPLCGLPDAEGRALSTQLWQAVEASPARYQSVMRSNDVYVWDNIATVHDNPAFARSQARSIWFLNIERSGEIEALS